MALDDALHTADGESLEVWAPVHAWRALGQLRAETAVVPLLKLLERQDSEDPMFDNFDDWTDSELPEVFTMIGTAAVPALTKSVNDLSHRLYAAACAASALRLMAEKYPEARAECLAAIARRLEHFQENQPDLNAFLISYLASPHALDYAPLMERAFAADAVDESIVGDWDEVQVALGLKRREDVPPKRFFPPFLGTPAENPDLGYQPSKKERQQQKAAKAKRKQAQKSRKLNRKKKKR
jgi:hypothetical protein